MMENVVKLPRRSFLRLAACAAALPAVSRLAWALDYPTRPVRLIVSFPPGGVADIAARLMGQWLTSRLDRPFVIENRAGASGNIGSEAAAKSAPDGYTLLEVTAVNAINVTLYDKLHFNFVRDIIPVASMMRVPGVMVVNPSFPAKTVPEFIAYAKANPGKINFGSGGNGSPSHVYPELFKMTAGIDMVQVPYRGTPLALTDLLGGQLQVVFDTVPSSIEHIRAGRLRALAVTTATRLDALPDVPTMSEFLPGYEASGWQGIGAPRGTPSEIIDKLNREVNAGLADPTIRLRFADLGGSVFAGSPADFGKLIAEETEKWAKVVKFAGIKPQ
jgi:tripartite-type tricarboxylate transporter receptor subunit TctC